MLLKGRQASVQEKLHSTNTKYGALSPEKDELQKNVSKKLYLFEFINLLFYV
jgi:hypothetical protein